MSQISLLLKVTHNCNLSCSYCYDAQMAKDRVDTDMSIEKIKKLVDLAAVYYKKINILFHGGEPLVRGVDFYKEVIGYCWSIPGVEFEFEMQTNGTLIDERIISLFSIAKIGFSISYDGLSTCKYRCENSKITDKITLVQSKGFFPSLVVVANNEFLDNIIEEYEHLKSLGIKSCRINWLFGDGITEGYTQKYIKKMQELYDYWCKDSDAISIAQFRSFVNLVNNYRTDSICNLNCHEHWLGMDNDGMLGLCDFGAYPKNINFGNVDDCSDLGVVLYGKERMKIVQEVMQRYRNCHDINCELVGKCSGGCNAQIYREFGNFNSINGQQCTIYRAMYSFLKQRLADIDIATLNPYIIRYFNEKKNERKPRCNNCG